MSMASAGPGTVLGLAAAGLLLALGFALRDAPVGREAGAARRSDPDSAARRVGPGPGEAPHEGRTGRRDRRSEAEAFLKTFPEARAVIRDVWRDQLRRSCAPFYLAARLTPAQIEAFEALRVRAGFGSLEVGPDSVPPVMSEPPLEELRQALGEEGVRLWRDYTRAGDARAWASLLALRVNNEGRPLTPDQQAELMRIVTSASPEHRAGGLVDRGTVDWGTVIAGAKSVLAEDQWSGAERFLVREQVAQLGGMRADAAAEQGSAPWRELPTDERLLEYLSFDSGDISQWRELRARDERDEVDLVLAAQELGLGMDDGAVMTFRQRRQESLRAAEKSMFGAGQDSLRDLESAARLLALVDEVASYSTFTTAPLARTQNVQLAHLLARASRDDAFVPASFDWDHVAEQASLFLPESQLAGVRAMARQARLRALLARFHGGGVASD